MKHSLLLFILISLLNNPLFSNTFTCGTIYVNQGALGANDGTSWDDAYTDLQDALSEAQLCDNPTTEIWVAKGTYFPSLDRLGVPTNVPQLRTFVINFRVKLYGGFAGHETDMSQRVLHLHETRLSGDHLSNDVLITDINNPSFPASSNTENSYNVMRISSERRIRIDGFTFIGGNASDNVDFTQGTGGAVYINSGNNTSGSLDCWITRCTFKHNTALFGGGAIYNNGELYPSNPLIEACIFASNASQSRDGGAIYNKATIFNVASPNIKSSLFHNNFADNRGGAIYNLSSGGGSFSLPFIDNCTFAGNSAGIDGGAIFSYLNSPGAGATPEILLKESIFYENTANGSSNSFSAANVGYDPQYCNYPEAPPNNNFNNTSVDPLFMGPENFRLQANSPLIDQGEPFSLVSPPPTIDLDDNNRRLGRHVDIGAYEFLSCPSSNIIYVNDDANVLRKGTNPSSPLSSLNMALSMACHCSGEPEIRVAAGSYIPHRLGNSLQPSGKSSHLEIKKTLKLLGGYSENFAVRDIDSYESIINGDINGDGNEFVVSDNVKNLMFVQDGNGGTLIEGMTFIGGNETKTGLNSNFASAPEIITSNTGYRLDINRCKFIGNRNSSAKGTIYLQDHANVVELFIDSSEFIGNQSLQGGACINFIHNSGTAKLHVTNSKIETNSSGSHGAINYKSDSNGSDEFIVNTCRFEENSTQGSGSCVNAIMNGSAFSRIFIEHSEFEDNNAEDDGGSISVSVEDRCSFNLKSSIFIFNSANFGGAYYYRNGLSSGRNDPRIENCIFLNNSADHGGGAIVLEASNQVSSIQR